jgi:phospholipid/cholesterol/gamma-HCH transport system substrate-binding protein
MRSRAGRLLGLVLAALAGLGALTGCAVNAAEIPVPVSEGGPTYRVTAVFADALNLPDGAHVRVGGDDVGRVRTITARDYTARVEMAVREDVRLPAGTTAELRQATPLGEVFVALTPPAAGRAPGPALRDGDVIGPPDTASGATVEDLLAALSGVVNGGGLAQVQTIVHEVNAATDGRSAQYAHLLDQATRTMSTLNARTADFDRLLAATDRLSATLVARHDTVDAAFDDLSPGLRELADQTDRLTTALTAAGRVSTAADSVLHRTDPELRHLLRDIGPVLDGVVATGPTLGQSLRDVVYVGKVLEDTTKGEAVIGRKATFQLSELFATPRPGDRVPGLADFADGGRSLADRTGDTLGLKAGGR